MSTTIADQFNTFIAGAADAALWSTIPLDDDGMGDVTADELEIGGEELIKLRCTIVYYARDWFIAHYPLIRSAMSDNPEYNDWTQVGYDWWLTTQGHGAGFWDRGLGTAGDALTDSCGGYEGILELYLDSEGILRVDTYNVMVFDESLDGLCG